MAKYGVRMCIVKDCLNVYYPGCRTRFHRFPKNVKKKERWLKSLKLTPKDQYAGAKVCYLHFNTKDYVNNNPGSCHLKFNVVPSINESRQYSDCDSDAESIDIDQILENLSEASSPVNLKDISDCNDDFIDEELPSSPGKSSSDSDDDEFKNIKVQLKKNINRFTKYEPNDAKKNRNLSKRVMILYPENKEHNFVEESVTIEQDDMVSQESDSNTSQEDVGEKVLTQESKPETIKEVDVEKVLTRISESETVKEDNVENVLTQVCRTCLATECKMYSIKQHNLEQAYIQLTGICSDMFDETTKMPEMLCFECVQRFKNYIDFSAKSIMASHLLMGLIEENKLTMADIKSIDRHQNLLASTLSAIHFNINDFDIQLDKQEYENKDSDELHEVDPNILDENGIKDTEDLKSHDNFEEVNMDIDFHDNETVFKDYSQGVLHLGIPSDDRKEVDEESDVTMEETFNGETGEVDENEYCFRGKRDVPRKRINKEFNELFIIKNLTSLEQKEELENRKNGREYLNANFKCDKCFRGFQFENPFSDHMKRHTLEFGEFICDICQMHFRTRRLVSQHIRHSHWATFSCRKCSFNSTFRHTARLHKNRHDGFRFRCKICPKHYSKLVYYLDHMRHAHPEDAVCHVCGLSFAIVQDLDRHLRLAHRNDNLHLAEDGPHCSDCGIRFRDEAALQVHMSHSPRHGNDPVFKPRKHKNKYQQRPGKINVRVTCEQCGKEFTNMRSFRRHLTDQHPSANRTQYSGPPRLHMCDVCGKMFTSWSDLKEHREAHDGVTHSHPCNKCKKVFSSKSKLYLHRLNHGSSRQCDVCGKRFRYVSTLNNHMRAHKNKPYSCEICPKRFLHPSEKRTHTLHAHMGVPYPKKRPKDAPRLRRRRRRTGSFSSSD